MDCPSEENLIRMKLSDFSSIEGLEFDLEARELSIFYSGPIDAIHKSIDELQLNVTLMSTAESDGLEVKDGQMQKKLLGSVFLINLLFFVLEFIFGLIGESMGLMADSLDMLADSIVYGLALMAIGSSVYRKKKVALTAGYIQILLTSIGFIEVFRRFIFNENLPDINTMIVISLLALIANGVCLYLLQKSRNKDQAHIKASLIFTSNDIIINCGVIAAALLVMYFKSPLPDLIISSFVFVLVLKGANRILKLAK